MKKMIKLISGSVTTILSLGLLAVLFGRRAFTCMVRNELDSLLGQCSDERQTMVTDEMLEGLPEPVRRYLRYTGVVGKPIVRTAYLTQAGTMRLAVNQPRIPLTARQWYTIKPAGFIWDGTMHLGPLPLARARDRYSGGKGNMLVKAGSLVTVVNATGKEMDQGSMMRYLSEMIWFPSAFVRDNITFEPVDDMSARVTLTDHGRSVTGTLHFDEEGRLTNFVAKRYWMTGGAFELRTWSTPVTEYGHLAGLNLPVRGKAVWNLPDGDLEYIDVSISTLEYNLPQQGNAEVRRAGRHESRTKPLVIL